MPVIPDPAAYPLMVGSRTVPGDQSPEFARALNDLRGARLRPEIRLTEVPAPQRIAPYAVALTAEVVGAPPTRTSWPRAGSSCCTTPPPPSRGTASGAR